MLASKLPFFIFSRFKWLFFSRFCRKKMRNLFHDIIDKGPFDSSCVPFLVVVIGSPVGSFWFTRLACCIDGVHRLGIN